MHRRAKRKNAIHDDDKTKYDNINNIGNSCIQKKLEWEDKKDIKE